MDVQQAAPLVPQIVAWVNTLTLPGSALLLWRVSRWVTEKEDAITAKAGEFQKSMENIRDNHLHHIQMSLDEIKGGQEKMAEANERHQTNLVTAMNSSKDAIVNAIINTRK